MIVSHRVISLSDFYKTTNRPKYTGNFIMTTLAKHRKIIKNPQLNGSSVKVIGSHQENHHHIYIISLILQAQMVNYFRLPLIVVKNTKALQWLP